ncbi:MAG: hypothetical protein O9301_15380 [Leptospira sp.]|nr:hypothetical protein [Leptospira sp.]
MKRNILQWTGIAALSALSLTACNPDRVKEEPILAVLLSTAVRGAAQGNCAISINVTGLYTGAAVSLAVSGAFDGAASNQFRTHYNAVTGKSIASAAALSAEPYNLKYDVFFTDGNNWTDSNRASYVNTLVLAAEGTAFDVAAPGTSTRFNNLKAIRGTGLLACTRIPRTNCSLGGATTANRAADIQNQLNVYNSVVTNTDCFRNAPITASLRTNIFKGTPNDISLAIADDPAGLNNPTSNGDTSSLNSNQQILGEKMYPKFGTLVTLGFGSLMPMISGTSAHSVNASSLTRGSNINFTLVDSCESVGLPGGGFVGTGGTPLTPAVEVAYTLSTGGSAASAYAAARSLTTFDPAQTASLEADNCNDSFRDKFSIPLALGGGKLAKVTGISGDGGKTALLTACTYGSTTGTRGTANGVLAASATILTGLASCPASAAPAAAKFGDAGLQNLANFPND